MMRDDCTGRRDPTVDDLDCHAAVRRLWDYLDGELRPDDQRAVDAHLADCRKCPPHFDFERAFLRAVSGARTGARTGRPDTAALRDRIVRALARDGFPRR